MIVSLVCLEGGGIWTFVNVEDGEKDCFEHGGCERYAGAANAAAMIGLLHCYKIWRRLRVKYVTQFLKKFTLLP